MTADDFGIEFGPVAFGIVVLGIGNAEAAAEIDMGDVVAVGAQLTHEIGENGESAVERREIGDLRADMHVDAGDLDPRKACRPRIDLAGDRDRDAELVFGLAGRDFGVGLGVDVRIDADGDRCGLAPRKSDLRNALQLRLGFDVEAENAVVERQGDFPLGLADAGEGDALAAERSAARARRNSPSDTTSMPAPRPREQGQHGLIRIGFHRIADERVEIAQRLAKRQ